MLKKKPDLQDLGIFKLVDVRIFTNFLKTYPNGIRCEHFSSGWGYFDETSGKAIAYWRTVKHEYWITT